MRTLQAEHLQKARADRERQAEETRQIARRAAVNKARARGNTGISTNDDYQLAILDFLVVRIHSLGGTRNESRSTSVIVLSNEGSLFFFTQRWLDAMHVEIDSLQREFNIKIHVVKSSSIQTEHNFHAECLAFQSWLNKQISRIVAIGVSKAICPRCWEILTNVSPREGISMSSSSSSFSSSIIIKNRGVMPADTQNWGNPYYNPANNVRFKMPKAINHFPDYVTKKRSYTLDNKGLQTRSRSPSPPHQPLQRRFAFCVS